MRLHQKQQKEKAMFSINALEAITKIRTGFEELEKLKDEEGITYSIESPSDDGCGLCFEAFVITDGTKQGSKISVLEDDCIYPEETDIAKIHEMTMPFDGPGE